MTYVRSIVENESPDTEWNFEDFSTIDIIASVAGVEFHRSNDKKDYDPNMIFDEVNLITRDVVSDPEEWEEIGIDAINDFYQYRSVIEVECK